MAQFLTLSQAKSFEIQGNNYDLINLIEALERTPDGWVSPTSVNELTVGQIVHVWALGDRLRRGVVAKLGRTKVTVVFTTQGAVNDAARSSRTEATIRVADTAVQLSQIKILAPAASVEEPAEDPRQWATEGTEYPARKPAEETEYTRSLAETYNQATGTQDAQAEYASVTAQCPNNWHRSAPVRSLILCPECASPVAEETPAQDLTPNSQDCKVDPESEDNEPEGDEMNTETQATTTENTDAPATPTQTGDMTGSAVVKLMEEVWGRIRENHPELPAVVIVTGSGMIGPSRWGHFRANGWMARAEGETATTNLALGEMFMAGETLAKGARQVLQTMLHEGAHVIAKVRELKDTSRQGRWHNKTFKALAEELGLEHKRASADTQHGFSFVTLTEATEAKYADLLDELDREIRLVVDLPWFLKGTERSEGETEGNEDEGGEYISKGRKPTTTTPQSGNLKATCACAEPNIIRASRKVLDLGVIRCDECEHIFTA